jgi:hypothetical protein
MISSAYPDLEDKFCRAKHNLATSFDKGIEIIDVMLGDTGAQINSFL